MDTLTPAERSKRMSLVRGKDTKPEMLVRRLVHGMGFRYRLHARDLPGKPDLVERVRIRFGDTMPRIELSAGAAGLASGSGHRAVAERNRHGCDAQWGRAR